MIFLILFIILFVFIIFFLDTKEYMINYSQTPWFDKWNNGKNKFICCIDKHLNRKCSWKCA